MSRLRRLLTRLFHAPMPEDIAERVKEIVTERITDQAYDDSARLLEVLARLTDEGFDPDAAETWPEADQEFLQRLSQSSTRSYLASVRLATLTLALMRKQGGPGTTHVEAAEALVNAQREQLRRRGAAH